MKKACWCTGVLNLQIKLQCIFLSFMLWPCGFVVMVIPDYLQKITLFTWPSFLLYSLRVFLDQIMLLKRELKLAWLHFVFLLYKESSFYMLSVVLSYRGRSRGSEGGGPGGGGGEEECRHRRGRQEHQHGAQRARHDQQAHAALTSLLLTSSIFQQCFRSGFIDSRSVLLILGWIPIRFWIRIQGFDD